MDKPAFRGKYECFMANVCILQTFDYFRVIYQAGTKEEFVCFVEVARTQYIETDEEKCICR